MADPVISTNQREFRCKHCDGKILIPKDLPPTSGPCPHCAGVITSPANDEVDPPFKALAIPLPTAPPVEEKPAVRPPAPPAPEVRKTEELPNAVLPPPKAEKIELPSREDHSELNRPKKQKPAKPVKARSGLIPAMLVLLVLVMLGGAVVYLASKELGRDIDPPTVRVASGDPAIREAAYIRIGWQKEAYQLLRSYMTATTTEEKVSFILNGPALATKIEDFYGGGVINDSDTPAEAFSIYELSEEDRKRGLFMMVYDQPPQFEMREFFRPLASLEVQYGVDEADLLLSTLSRVGNFAMEPLRVHAFFKRSPEGLKLDWEIFAQTKYRTLQNFTELPEIGQIGIFRVFIVEDVPDKGRAVAGTRTYRVVDPANTTDSARVNVKVDSETGRALSLINWRGTTENHPITRTATVELRWGGAVNAPELEISRFVCWEFLGLGGQSTPATESSK